jgi:MFS family permease
VTSVPPSQQTAAAILWRQPDFRYLWAAQAVSLAGSAVTSLALPLTAALLLGASPAQMGLLGAATGAPALLFSLVVGAWVDRWPRRPILVAADVARALLLGTIPLAALLGGLRMAHLYAVAFAVGSLSLLFDIAATSFLPAVLLRQRLVEGNSALQLGEAVTRVAGPSAAGVLVQLVTAPVAIAADALSYLASALLLSRIRTREPAPVQQGRQRLWREISEGVRLLLGHPALRAMTVSSALGSLAMSIQGTLLVLYATGDLGLTPSLLGLVFSSRGLTSLLGAALAGPLGRRLGAGRAIVWGTLAEAVGALLLPLASGPLTVAVPLLVAGQALLGAGTPVYSVNQVSLRQALTPDRLLGRVNAGRRFVVFGIGPVGALLGGALGEGLGVRLALFAGGLSMALAFFAAWLSPLRTLGEPRRMALDPLAGS